MSEDTHPNPTFRGFQRITEFLRIELDEPDLRVSTVTQWARSGKIDVDRFGPRQAISNAARLRASIGKTSPEAA
jgi:hypothetical protein